jgi:hypothetical protein
MRLEGLPLKYSRQDLEKFASHKALAAIRCEQPNGHPDPDCHPERSEGS